jgi:O-antigen/teichoic acid export membrane protein
MNLTKRAPLLYLIGAAVQGLAAVAVQPFSIRLFGGAASHGWETTAYSVTVMQVGLVVLSAGLPMAITRAWLDPDDGPTQARAISGFNALLAIAMSAVACVIAWLLHTDPSMIAAIWSMGALAVVLAAQAQLRSEGKPLHFVALAAGSSLVAHLFGLASILLLHPTPVHFMVGFALASTLTAVAAVLITRPTMPRQSPEAVRLAMKAGLPLLPHSLAMVLLTQGDAILLKALAPQGAAGVYLAAAVFALGPIAVLAGLNNSWTPAIMKAAHGDPGDFRAVTGKTLRTATMLAAGMSVLGSLGAWLGMLVLAGGNHGATEVAAVLPLVGIGYALYLISMSVLFATLSTQSFAWVTITVVIIAGAAAFWPASRGDLVATAYAKVLGFTLLGAGYALMARSRTELPLRLTALGLAAGVVVSVAVLAVLNLVWS